MRKYGCLLRNALGSAFEIKYASNNDSFCSARCLKSPHQFLFDKGYDWCPYTWTVLFGCVLQRFRYSKSHKDSPWVLAWRVLASPCFVMCVVFFNVTFPTQNRGGLRLWEYRKGGIFAPEFLILGFLHRNSPKNVTEIPNAAVPTLFPKTSTTNAYHKASR